MLERRLTRAERRIGELEDHLTQQRSVIAGLEAAGRGTTETAAIAREILATMELNLTRQINERKRLHMFRR